MRRQLDRIVQFIFESQRLLAAISYMHTYTPVEMMLMFLYILIYQK